MDIMNDDCTVYDPDVISARVESSVPASVVSALQDSVPDVVAAVGGCEGVFYGFAMPTASRSSTTFPTVDRALVEQLVFCRDHPMEKKLLFACYGQEVADRDPAGESGSSSDGKNYGESSTDEHPVGSSEEGHTAEGEECSQPSIEKEPTKKKKNNNNKKRKYVNKKEKPSRLLTQHSTPYEELSRIQGRYISFYLDGALCTHIGLGRPNSFDLVKLEADWETIIDDMFPTSVLLTSSLVPAAVATPSGQHGEDTHSSCDDGTHIGNPDGLTFLEWRAIRSTGSLMDRLHESYCIFLHFFGFQMFDQETGKLDRHSGWRERYAFLEKRREYWATWTRVLRCLLDFRLFAFGRNAVWFLVEEFTAGRLLYLRPVVELLWLPYMVADAGDRQMLARKLRKLDDTDSD